MAVSADRPPAVPPLRTLAPAAAALVAGLALARNLAGIEGTGKELALSALLGIAFGAVLQRSRFCFYCVTRDFLDRRDARGLLGILAALATGTLGYHLLFGAFLPDPSGGRLPPGAHIGPVSWVLAAGATSFGLGMALSGSCISAHLYRIGEGSLASPLALLGAAGGFVLGFLSWNGLYLGTLQAAPVVWLPASLGYAGSAAAQIGLIAIATVLLARAHRAPPAAAGPQAWWARRWPAHVGGILVGFIGVLSYLRLGPLGVTAELGSLARTAASGAAWFPLRLEGLDGFAGCATAVKETLWSQNGAFVAGLVLGAFGAALSGGDFRPRLPGAAEALRALLGGLLMGWGAMVALGCTVGTLLSGIMAAALSGWVFAVFLALGTFLGWLLRKRRGW
ncbi:YeeE/YedE family protein [Thauera sinica]|uniref:YeeE/YedE family protein n=2 Tax=Thauera TaxID=33057 RepID=A0ABW1AQA9_9RHOO|nr:hypothetical protein CCZ27_05800 [Thauera sp. K11]